MRLFPAALCLLALLLWPLAVAAHGDLHDQIRALTRAIATAPRDATLYLRRGELYRAHHAPSRARADYARALALDPTLDAARLARARLLVETGHPRQAQPDLDAFLARHPADVTATLVRARARRALGDIAGAVADYDHVLAAAPDPDRGLERARLLAGTGQDSDRREAVAGLDALQARLGTVVTLELEAIALLTKGRDYDSALVRLDRAIAQGPRADRWLMRKGALLTHAGRPAEARAAYQAAREALAALPPSRQLTRDTQRERAAIDRALANRPSTVQGPNK